MHGMSSRVDVKLKVPIIVGKTTKSSRFAKAKELERNLRIEIYVSQSLWVIPRNIYIYIYTRQKKLIVGDTNPLPMILAVHILEDKVTCHQLMLNETFIVYNTCHFLSILIVINVEVLMDKNMNSKTQR